MVAQPKRGQKAKVNCSFGVIVLLENHAPQTSMLGLPATWVL